MATTTPARTATASATASAQQQARVLQLAHAHRATQATHRAALTAEHPGPVDGAQTRLQSITTALRQAAHPALAAALDAEATTGAVLQCLLTADDDTSAAGLDGALADYQHRRADVDALLPTTGPTTPGLSAPLPRPAPADDGPAARPRVSSQRSTRSAGSADPQ